MAGTEVLTMIIEITADGIKYMLPIIGLLSGVNLLISMLYAVTFKAMGKAGSKL